MTLCVPDASGAIQCTGERHCDRHEGYPCYNGFVINKYYISHENCTMLVIENEEYISYVENYLDNNYPLRTNMNFYADPNNLNTCYENSANKIHFPFVLTICLLLITFII